MQDKLEKAKNYVFLLLKFRPRSEQEIRQRLKLKKFDPQIISQTISSLKDKDFINDSYFAGAWIDARLKRPLGLRRIRQELRLKGIANDIINEKIEQAKASYCEEETVKRLIQQRFRTLKDVEPKVAKARIFSYLMRRGFSPDAVIEAMSQL